MPSATTADNSDSIEPKRAMVKAGPTRDNAWASETCGKDSEGRVRGIPP